jgi:3-phenylpropionate/cinnamic acid dioxygenase small subunit
MRHITDTTLATGPDPATVDVSTEVYLAIQRFLFVEAGLLDRRDYRRWLSLLTDDVSYRVLAQVNRDGDAGPLPYAIIDENALRLKARVEQVVNSKLTHAENPPTLTRRFVSNVLAVQGGRDGEYAVTSNILVYRTRPHLPEGALYAGERNDILRRVDGALRIARRDVQLDQALLYGSMSTLF